MEPKRDSHPGPVAFALGHAESGPVRSERFELTDEARGPWQGDAAHGGAPTALLARTAEGHASDGLRLAALSATFFGPVMLGEITIESEVAKPGSRQRVIALRVIGSDRVLMDARAVLLRQGEVDLPPRTGRGARMEGPGEGRSVDRSRWADGSGPAFHRTANTVLATAGGPDRVGVTGAAWFRLDAPLVEGERPSPVQRAVSAADFGNGVAHPIPFGEYLFANCDLNVSFQREPEGEWIGLRAHTEIDPGGAGLTTTEIFDAGGRVGAATQILFVERV